MKNLIKLFSFSFLLIKSQTISLNPDSIYIDIFPGDTTLETFTIFNTGTDTLEVNIAPKNCGDYTIFELPYSHTGTTLGKQDDWPVNNGNSAGPDNAYFLNVITPMSLDITLCSPETNYDARLEIFTVDYECVETTTEYSNDDDPGCEDFDTVAAVFPPSGIWDAYLETGEYIIVVDGFTPSETSPPGSGEYKISVQESAGTRTLTSFNYQDRLDDQIEYYKRVGKNINDVYTRNIIENNIINNNERSSRDLVNEWITISPVDTIVLPDSSQDISIYIEVAEDDSGGVYRYPLAVFSNDTINPLIILEMELSVPDIFPPGVPRNIITSINPRDISLLWNPVTGQPAMYKIYRSIDGSSFSLIDSVLGQPPEAQYFDFMVQIEQVYFYQLSSVDSSGNESARSSIVSAIIKNSVIITEIMNNPSSVSDEQGEWFEIYNDGTTMISFMGWTISGNNTEQYTFTEELVILPGEYIVLGVNSDSSSNGGINISHQYNNIILNDTSDALLLIDNIGTTHDSVGWDNGITFPQGEGASMSLLGLGLDNSVGSNWALSDLPIGNGDFGSPGGPNYYSSIMFNQDSLFFSSTGIGAAMMQQITVFNSGNSMLQIDTVVSDNSDFSVLYPDTSFMTVSYIDVWFNPSISGQINGSINVFSNSYDNPEKSVQVFGFGYVDSLAPSVPEGFSGVFSDNTALFTWSENPEDDIGYYVIDKSNEIDFTDNEYARFISINTWFVDSTYTLGESAHYRLCAVDHVGNSGDFSETIQITILNSESKSMLPGQYALHQNFPNPFNPATTIQYEIKDAGDVTIEIFSVLGKRVKRYTNLSQPAGYYSMKWMGKNEQNKYAGAGIYFYSLTVNGYTKTRKMVLLK